MDLDASQLHAFYVYEDIVEDRYVRLKPVSENIATETLIYCFICIVFFLTLHLKIF